jgi:hypothetical protein
MALVAITMPLFMFIALLISFQLHQSLQENAASAIYSTFDPILSQILPQWMHIHKWEVEDIYVRPRFQIEWVQNQTAERGVTRMSLLTGQFGEYKPE